MSDLLLLLPLKGKVIEPFQEMSIPTVVIRPLPPTSLRPPSYHHHSGRLQHETQHKSGTTRKEELVSHPHPHPANQHNNVKHQKEVEKSEVGWTRWAFKEYHMAAPTTIVALQRPSTAVYRRSCSQTVTPTDHHRRGVVGPIQGVVGISVANGGTTTPTAGGVKDSKSIHDCCVSHRESIKQLGLKMNAARDGGDYLEAQTLLDEQRSLAQMELVVQEKNSMLEKVNAQFKLKEDIFILQQRDQVNYKQLWESRMADFEAKAEVAVSSLRQSHAQLYEDRERLYQSERNNRHAHPSSNAIFLKSQIQCLLSGKKFKEADELRRELDLCAEKEHHRYDEICNATVAAKTLRMRSQQQIAMRNLLQRIQQAREDLGGQRDVNHMVLMQRYANQAGAKDQALRCDLAVKHNHQKRNLKAMLCTI